MGRVDQLAAAGLTEIGTQASAHLRFVTAASLFDGHDAAINIMRRILQSKGVEVIHLGHNRSVAEVVDAALQEDAHGIAISSYQGGHVEYLKYMLDLLARNGGENILVFAGGGGVIIPKEKAILEASGVTRIYTPEDGQQMGLEGMIEHMIETTLAHVRLDPPAAAPPDPEALAKGDLQSPVPSLVGDPEPNRRQTPVERDQTRAGAGWENTGSRHYRYGRRR